jgi:cbb3-type cytochrome oxidase cytochrome c subunit
MTVLSDKLAEATAEMDALTTRVQTMQADATALGDEVTTLKDRIAAEGFTPEDLTVMDAIIARLKGLGTATPAPAPAPMPPTT